MNYGITSQYGFLYQRMVFIYEILNNISKGHIFVFEGKDDIEISSNEKISSISINQDKCIQVKSGIVDISCFSKVVCNWLLLSELTNLQYYLILENELDFELTVDQQVDYIYNYIIKGQKKKKSSIARKTYDKFSSNISTVKSSIKTILDSYEKSIITIEKIDEVLFDTFKTDYCSDIKLYDMAVEKRLIRFIQLINDDIDNFIKNKKPYSIMYSQIISKIQQTCEEISDTQYKVNISCLKKSLISEATKLVEKKTSREVQQLFLVNSATNFVVENIVNELVYKDFRAVYNEPKYTDIINIEENASENYKDTVYSLSEEDKKIPKIVFKETTSKPICSELLMDSPIYRKGCYIFLSGDKIETEKQISWGINNED